ncbi:MAG: anti-sigma F factor [Clostridia bacterium]|nr:anti-sigma F factor [Clostridia bacterium]
MENYMKLEIAAISENESFARSAVAAFALSLNPTLNDLSDIKTAVSEAVTNCVVHAYGSKSARDKITIECRTKEEDGFGVIHITVTDSGCGIDDVEQATAPFYTTLPSEERSGMGFTIMQTFMDEFSVRSAKNEGTQVCMSKRIGWVKNGEIRELADA